MTFKEKEHFVKVTTPKLLENLRSKANPWWGKMNAQQMIEHLSDKKRSVYLVKVLKDEFCWTVYTYDIDNAPAYRDEQLEELGI